jgi:hypothetical protein
MLQNKIYIGWDPREAAAFAVARSSARRHLNLPIPIYGLVLQQLIEQGLYARPTRTKVNAEGRVEMVDIISIRPDYDGRISTQHANARFLVPQLAGTGWALFMDGDMLVRGNLSRVFEGLDRGKAIYCVPHAHHARPGIKMDGQLQTAYARKNWTSFILFNCDHPANRALSLDLINSAPGRDLHRLCWLDHDESLIGHLGTEWNWLVGESKPIDDPKVVHFTNGVPDMPGYENVPYADEWRAELMRWAA